MLNFQRTVIFCVLFAAVWVQSTKAMMTRVTPIIDTSDELIGNLEKSLNYVQQNKELIPQDGRDHFNSWGSWSDIPHFDKLCIARNYRQKLAAKNLTFNLWTDGDSKKILAILAYKALDDYVMSKLSDIEQEYTTNPNIVGAMKNVADQGKFLEYVVSKLGARGYLNRNHPIFGQK